MMRGGRADEACGSPSGTSPAWRAIFSRHEGYEDSLSEIEKMHNEMKRLYADMAKLEK